MTNEKTFGLNAVRQVSVTAKNLDRAVTFYREKLGIEHAFTVANMAFFDCGAMRIMLAVPERPELDHPSSVLYFSVDDIHDAYRILRRRGVEFEGQPKIVAAMDHHDLWMAFFRDSEGNLLSLMAEQPREL